MPSAVFTDSRFRLDYSVSTVKQEIDNNRSRVRRVLTIVKTGSSYAFSGNTSSWGSNGPNTQTGTFTYNFGNYSSLTLLDREDWVDHNADGTKVVNTSASVAADGILGTANVWSFDVTLPTIPRATTPTVSDGFTTGTAGSISLPRASSSFTHDVSYKIGTLTGTIATGAGTSASWNPPHTLMTALPNAASGTVEITVVTKNGSTVIGTKTVNFTLTANASVVPTVSGVAWTDNNPTVVTNIGAFVQGISLVKGTVSATGVHGSTITQKRILMGGQTFADGTAFIVNGSGTVTANGEATDSRGRVKAANSSFTVLPYLPPQIGTNGWQVRRANSSNVDDDNGQYLCIDLHAIASSLKPASTEKNALTIKVRTKATDAGWVNRNTIKPGLTHNTAFQVSGGAAFLTSKSYEVEITISDNTSAPPIVLRTVVGTAVVTLDLNGDKVGIGKMHENGTLDVAGDIYMNGTRVSVEGHTHTASAVASGTLAAARLPTATETAIGAVERATQAEVNAGTDTTRYVTPKTLASKPMIAFQATLTTDYTHTGGSAWFSPMPFKGIRFNYGGAYNPANGIFTAPVAGVYEFSASLLTSTSASGPMITMYKNGATLGYSAAGYASAYRSFGFTEMVNLNAGDTIQLYSYNANTSANTFPSFYGNLWSGKYLGPLS